MKLALVAVLVLCLALAECSLLKFSLRGLNRMAKRGHGGPEGGKEGSVGGREGGKEGVSVGGKEEGSKGLGHAGKEEVSQSLGHEGKEEEEEEEEETGEEGEGGEGEEGEKGEGEKGEGEDGQTEDSESVEFTEEPCPSAEQFKAKLLEVIDGVKSYDAVIQGVASKAMDFVEGGDTAFEDVANAYGTVLEETGKTFGALEFVGHYMTCAATEGTEFERRACSDMIEFAQTQEYDPEGDEEYKRKMAEAFLADLECFDAEYDLAAALGEEELAGETALSKKRAIGLLMNFIMELEAYGKNAQAFDEAVRTAYYKIQGAVQDDQPDKRGMNNERELRELLMNLLSRAKKHLRK